MPQQSKYQARWAEQQQQYIRNRVAVFISRDLHARLRKLAERDKCTLTSIVTLAVEKYLERETNE